MIKKRLSGWKRANAVQRKAHIIKAHEWQKVHPEAVKKHKHDEYERNKDHYRDYRLRVAYGISLDDYNTLLKKQHGVCAICGKSEMSRKRYLAVDHVKGTKIVRGLLCLNCNQGIGKLFHDPNLLRKAALYVESAT